MRLTSPAVPPASSASRASSQVVAPSRAASCDDGDLVGRPGPADQPDHQRPRLADRDRARGGTRAARTRWSGPGSSRSASGPTRRRSRTPGRRPGSRPGPSPSHPAGARRPRPPWPPPSAPGSRRRSAARRSSPATVATSRSSSASMLANDRVITIAASSPSGETSATSAVLRQRAVAAAGHGDGRVAGRAHPLRDLDRLRRRARARDDHHGLPPGRGPRPPRPRAPRPAGGSAPTAAPRRPAGASPPGPPPPRPGPGSRTSPAPGHDDPLGRGQDVAGRRRGAVRRRDRGRDGRARGRALAPGQQVVEVGHRSRSSTE